MEAVGLKLADLFRRNRPIPTHNGKPKSARTFPKPTMLWRIGTSAREAVGVVGYHDAGGEPVGLVVGQTRRKGHPPVARHGDGWRIGVMPDLWPLYGLPELATVACRQQKVRRRRTRVRLASRRRHGWRIASRDEDRLARLAGKEI